MFVDFTFDQKETSSHSILEGHALTKAVDLEGTEIDAETAEEAHVVAAETNHVALFMTASTFLFNF